MKEYEEIPEYNTNLLSLKGRIGRLNYFITSLNLFLTTGFIKLIITSFYSDIPADIIMYVFIPIAILILIIKIFAVCKRLRDIGWYTVLVLLLLIPFASLIFELLLFFVKSKYKQA